MSNDQRLIFIHFYVVVCMTDFLQKCCDNDSMNRTFPDINTWASVRAKRKLLQESSSSSDEPDSASSSSSSSSSSTLSSSYIVASTTDSNKKQRSTLHQQDIIRLIASFCNMSLVIDLTLVSKLFRHSILTSSLAQQSCYAQLYLMKPLRNCTPYDDDLTQYSDDVLDGLSVYHFIPSLFIGTHTYSLTPRIKPCGVIIPNAHRREIHKRCTKWLSTQCKLKNLCLSFELLPVSYQHPTNKLESLHLDTITFDELVISDESVIDLSELKHLCFNQCGVVLGANLAGLVDMQEWLRRCNTNKTLPLLSIRHPSSKLQVYWNMAKLFITPLTIHVYDRHVFYHKVNNRNELYELGEIDCLKRIINENLFLENAIDFIRGVLESTDHVFHRLQRLAIVSNHFTINVDEDLPNIATIMPNLQLLILCVPFERESLSTHPGPFVTSIASQLTHFMWDDYNESPRDVFRSDMHLFTRLQIAQGPQHIKQITDSHIQSTYITEGIRRYKPYEFFVLPLPSQSHDTYFQPIIDFYAHNCDTGYSTAIKERGLFHH